MSIMACSKCQCYVDTDDDPDSLYIVGHTCVCQDCRDFYDLSVNLNKSEIDRAADDAAMAEYDGFEPDDEHEDDEDQETLPIGADPDLSDEANFVKKAFEKETENDK